MLSIVNLSLEAFKSFRIYHYFMTIFLRWIPIGVDYANLGQVFENRVMQKSFPMEKKLYIKGLLL